MRPEFVPRRISRLEYEIIWKRERASAIPDIPSDPSFVQYRCSSRDFLTSRVYPAWFTDAARSKFIPAIEDPDQTPISFTELLVQPALCAEKLDEYRNSGRSRDFAHAIVETCLRCGVSVVKDGNKGLLAIAAGGTSVQMTVTQVSGDDWSQALYDMRKICRCCRSCARVNAQ